MLWLDVIIICSYVLVAVLIDTYVIVVLPVRRLYLISVYFKSSVILFSHENDLTGVLRSLKLSKMLHFVCCMQCSLKCRHICIVDDVT